MVHDQQNCRSGRAVYPRSSRITNNVECQCNLSGGKPPFLTCNLTTPISFTVATRAFIVISAIALLTSCTQLYRSDVKNATPSPSPSTAPSAAPASPQATNRLPSPTGFVNDFAEVIDPDSQSRLETLMTRLKDKSNIEFAVATVDTTNGEPIYDYSMAVAKEWGIGPKDPAEGGGLLLVVAVKDRQWRLQVTRSLEKDLPDEVCKQLGDQSLPLYKKGDYAGGIEKYADALIKRLEKQRKFTIQ